MQFPLNLGRPWWDLAGRLAAVQRAQGLSVQAQAQAEQPQQWQPTQGAQARQRKF